MTHTRHSISITIIFLLLASCVNDDKDMAITESAFSEYDEFEIYRPLPPDAQVLENGMAPLSAIIGGERVEFFRGIVNAGSLFHTIRLDGNHQVVMNLPEIKPGIFQVNDNSGFTQAFIGSARCATGEIRLIEVDEVNKRVSGNFSFAAIDESGNTIRVSNGKFINLTYEDLIPPQGNFSVSATINEKPWSASVFTSFQGAATFRVTGFNEIGNVAISMQFFQWAEEGAVIALENGSSQIALSLGKNHPELLGGTLWVDRNDNDRFEGRFEAVFDDYTFKDGRFSFEFR